MQLLPGVAARNDFNTGLNVRGGEADQNLVLLDGYQIYNPFHLGGLSSTFMDATVGGIELMTGAFPSRFGGRLSSVLDVKSAEDVRTGLHASADISVLATTGRVAGSFGGKVNWGNQVVGATASKDLAPGATVPLLGFLLGDSTTVAMSLSSSGFSTLLDLGDGALSQRSEVRDVRLGLSLVTRGESHDRSVGYEVAAHRLRYSAGSSQTATSDFDLVQRPVSNAIWIDDLWRLSSKWLVDGGVRAEALTRRNWAAISPRVALKYFLTPSLALTAGAGRIMQWQHSLAGDGPLRYFDIWIASDSFIPVATAWHYVAGAERRFGDAGSVKLEGYVKRYDNVQEANRTENPQIRGDEFFSATGMAYGVDFLARWQRSSGASGWFSYSYGMSTRTRDGVTWAPGNDRRHDLNIVTTRPLAKYRVGARFGFATGTPFTPIVGGIARRIYDPSTDRWGTGDPQIFIESLGGAHNSERYPANHRLDLDISREYIVRGAKVAPYLSVANAYNAKNVFVYLYNYNTDSPTRRAISQFPILPSAGVRLEF